MRKCSPGWRKLDDLEIGRVGLETDARGRLRGSAGLGIVNDERLGRSVAKKCVEIDTMVGREVQVIQLGIEPREGEKEVIQLRIEP
jgi:hypothetical protein